MRNMASCEGKEVPIPEVLTTVREVVIRARRLENFMVVVVWEKRARVDEMRVFGIVEWLDGGL